MSSSVVSLNKPCSFLTCSRCGKTKPATEFARNKTLPRGYQDQCKNCQALERMKRREAKRQYGKDYYRKNKQRMDEQHRTYMRKHREKKRAYAFIERARKKDPNAYSIAKLCEACPSEDQQPATERHHPDHRFPTIFISVCRSCHKWAESSQREVTP